MKHTITVQDRDIAFDCHQDVSVLHAMIGNGKGPYRHGCCGGGCGICLATIVSGDICEFKPMSAAHACEKKRGEGIVLLCCIQPRSDLIIAVS